MDFEGLKQSFNDLLECPVCFQTIDCAPIHQCLHGHIVCKDCHPNLEHCPICTLGPISVRNLKIEEMVKMDLEGVKLSFKDILDCPICFLTIDSAPIYQCINGHVVCKDCHPKLDNCPICRDEKCYNPKLGFCREDKHFNLKVRNRKLEEIIRRYCIK